MRGVKKVVIVELVVTVVVFGLHGCLRSRRRSRVVTCKLSRSGDVTARSTDL